MKRVIKFDYLLNPINQKKIDDLCQSIIEKCDGRLGWEQLTQLSGFTHKELIALFKCTNKRRPWRSSNTLGNLGKLTRQFFLKINFFQNS
jgi:hypothetical protein